MSQPATILIVIPYFGKLPNYFPLTLASMGRNETIDWLIITDDSISAPVPPNVTIREQSFEALRGHFQSQFDFELALDRAYKLCDFKPAYGDLLNEDVKPYDFWGHADLDVIFGDIRKFLTYSVFEGFEKILIRGAFSLYRNCQEMNSLYRMRVPGVNYRVAFSDPQSYWFDEWKGLYKIVKDQNVRFWNEDVMFDISVNHFDPRTTGPRRPKSRFVWNDGRIQRMSATSSDITGEAALIHLQKRPMRSPSHEVLEATRYEITGGDFIPLEQDLRRQGLTLRTQLPQMRDFYSKVLKRKRATAVKQASSLIHHASRK